MGTGYGTIAKETGDSSKTFANERKRGLMEPLEEKIFPQILNDLQGDIQRLQQHAQDIYNAKMHTRNLNYLHLRQLQYQMEMTQSRVKMLIQAYDKDM